MKWLETEQLPEVCQNCHAEDCYQCDEAGKRWYLSQEDALNLRRKGLQKAIDRLQRQLFEVEEKLKSLTKR